MARKNEIGLRLSVEDEDKLKKALREIGEDGERMANKIDRASKKSSRGLQALDATTGELRAGMDGLADSLGPVGAGLKALGPLGLAAGASVGALALGLGAAVRVGKDAVDAFSEIGNSADRVGLATATFQGLRAEMDANGISASVLETGMAALKERQSQLVLGTGELVSRLKDSNPQLLAQLEALDNTEDQLRAVTDAMQRAKSDTERNTIAYAAFGEAGAQLGRVLMSNEDGIDGIIAKGRELGLVLENDMIRNAQNLSTEMDNAAKKMDLQFKQAFIDFAPVALDTIELLAKIAKGMNDIRAAGRDASLRSSGQNEDRLGVLRRQLGSFGFSDSELNAAQRAGGGLTAPDGVDPAVSKAVADYNRTLEVELERSATERAEIYRRSMAGLTTDQLKAELDAVEAYLADFDQKAVAFAQTKLDGLGLKLPDGATGADVAAADGAVARRRSEVEGRAETIRQLIEESDARAENKAAIEAQRAATEAATKAAAEAQRREAEMARLRTEAVRILGELGDHTLQLADYQDRLNKMVDAGLLSPEQGKAAYQAYIDQITGVTEATAKWVALVEGARSPVEVLEGQLATLEAQHEAGTVKADLYAKALAVLTEALDEARTKEVEDTPGHKAAERIRAELETARKEALGLNEKMAEEQARVNDLVASGNLTMAEATEWLDVYRDKLKEVQNEINLWTEAEQILDGIQQGRIRTIKDFGTALLAMLADVIRQAAMAQAQLENQSFGGFLQGVFGQVLGSFGLGGSGGKPPGPGLHGSSAGNVFPSHSGSIVGQPMGERRSLAHGIAGDERLRLVRVGQEIVPADERRRLIDYLQDGPPAVPPMMPGGAGDMTINVNVRAEGGEAEVTQSRGANGEVDIDVVFRDKMRAAAGSGALNDTLESQGFRRESRR